MRKHIILLGLSSLLMLGAADEMVAPPPKSPKASDALRLNAAAIRKASAVYWSQCETADRHLQTELKSAADAAHARNDGKEEQACLDAAKDVQDRIDFEQKSRMSPASPLDSLKCQTKATDKKDDPNKEPAKKGDETKPK